MVSYRDDWHPYAKEYVNQVEQALKELGCFESVDGFNLNLLGDSLTLYLKAKKQLDDDGLVVTDQKGRTVAHPAFSVVRSQQAIITSLMKELSLSLRQRRLLQKDNMVSEDSPISQLFDMMNE